jgi:hypothetical protein
LTISTQRSPNFPAVQTITRSPGEKQLDTEASMAPVPDATSTSTSWVVPSTSFRSASTRV